MISLPSVKLKNLSDILNKQKEYRQSIPDQTHYRKRQQEFYWENNVCYGDDLPSKINLVGCLEKYYSVNKKTGEIETTHSTYKWISNIRLSLSNVHDLCNLGARKKELI